MCEVQRLDFAKCDATTVKLAKRVKEKLTFTELLENALNILDFKSRLNAT